MKLADLLRGLPIEAGGASPALEVTGVQHDSRRVVPGDLYVAIIGARFDGRDFVPEAAARGAVAVLGAVAALGTGPAPRAATAGCPLPWLSTADPRAVLAPLAARVHGHPERSLTLVGVTGTNGKSTVATLAASLLDHAGRPAGFLGTLGYRFGGRDFPGDRTTPEASDFYALLAAMRDAGAQAVAMEVSSHALSVGRVDGALFAVAAFTNLSRDHFDFHPDFESYYRAKRRLFDRIAPGGAAVVGTDDPYGRRLLTELAGKVRTLSYGADGEVRWESTSLSAKGSRGVAATPRGPLEIATPLLGSYNLTNVLAAIAIGEALGLPHEATARALAEARPLTGRLEPVDLGQDFPVLVDYAHTPAALDAAARSVRELSGRKLILVFGCGGDRDPGKRPLMGELAGNLAELPIATTDNPRSEDPLAILAAVEEGLKASRSGSYRIVPDRREAIGLAVELAGPEWAVLVAGKGHEQRQIFHDRVIAFSDRDELTNALEARLGHAAHR
ncbi:MAG TPA: UDP-N-acetylmuramoyl-L-alanyl-D-glutamate--2,6-diaminopimelate ligase [Thermoanaerobaculia bacterium]|nr:UDP-N-acetylmuramoyl-L-alanyl-D-glutamate--2,6-diaminopimelate ligase [Thermoanaerobaculia bacterium]